jgi:hypothetical protein
MTQAFDQTPIIQNTITKQHLHADGVPLLRAQKLLRPKRVSMSAWPTTYQRIKFNHYPQWRMVHMWNGSRDQYPFPLTKCIKGACIFLKQNEWISILINTVKDFLSLNKVLHHKCQSGRWLLKRVWWHTANFYRLLMPKYMKSKEHSFRKHEAQYYWNGHKVCWKRLINYLDSIWAN